jgi:hypothetical protein
MADPPPEPPKPDAKPAVSAKETRRAAALKRNLGRRKAGKNKAGG